MNPGNLNSISVQIQTRLAASGKGSVMRDLGISTTDCELKGNPNCPNLSKCSKAERLSHNKHWKAGS